MKVMMLLVAACVSGCQGLTDFVNALPQPTPQENCEMSNGTWHAITTYDAAGNATDAGGECVSNTRDDNGRKRDKR